MMKRTVTYGPLILFFLCLTCSAEALCIKVSAANVRSGPGTQYEVVWKVYRYMPFEKVGESLPRGWYAVKDVDGEVNWLSRHLVRKDIRCAVVKKVRTNVRKGPGMRYGKTFWSPAPQYSSFKVLHRKGLWVKVKSEWGEVGWVYKNNLWIR
jgi:SH3-like domain-containing protein